MAFKTLGKYELIEKLGEGATADVYLATDTVLKRKVALKVLKPSLVPDSSAFARFTQEAQGAAALFHSHIATALDMGQANGYYFIAMRYVPGRSLDRLLKEDGPLSWEQVLRMAGQIGEAMDYAHKQGFLHRDVKPSNIICTPDGDYVLTDFGLMRAMMSTGLTSHTGAILGTPSYIPPEIWEGQPAGPGTDQYALACVVYVCLTGWPLFDGETPPSVMKRHFDGWKAPSRWRQGIPSGIDAVLSKALVQTQTDRYPSATAFSQALKELNTGLQPAPKKEKKAGSPSDRVEVQASSEDKKVTQPSAEGSQKLGLPQIQTEAVCQEETESPVPQKHILLLTETIRRQPNNADAYFQRAQIRAEIGENKNAIQDFSEALRLHPAFLEVYYRRGNLYEKAGNLGAAIQDYTQAITFKQDLIKALFSRGLAQFRMGKRANLNNVVSDFSKAIENKSDFADAYFWRGVVRKKIGNWDAAIQDFTEVIRLQPDNAEAYLHRSTCWRNKKDKYAAGLDSKKYAEIYKEKYRDTRKVIIEKGRFTLMKFLKSLQTVRSLQATRTRMKTELRWQEKSIPYILIVIGLATTIPFVIGIVVLVAGIGLFWRKEWARKTSLVFSGLLEVAGVTLFVYGLLDPGDPFFVLISLAGLIVISYMYSVLKRKDNNQRWSGWR